MKRKIDFLDRLFKVMECRVEVLQFLKDERLITDDVMQSLLHEQHQTHSTKIAMMLDELAKSEELQVCEYEWTILPTELLRLTLVSSEAKKVFEYSV